jgi:hypothetical protein
VAVAVVHRLVSTDHSATDRPSFQRLANEFEEDRWPLVRLRAWLSDPSSECQR